VTRYLEISPRLYEPNLRDSHSNHITARDWQPDTRVNFRFYLHATIPTSLFCHSRAKWIVCRWTLLVVFTSLKTFRQTTCAFYVTTASIASIDESLIVLIRFVNTSLNFYALNTSIFCKFRYFLTQYCALGYLTNICMATIDQFLSMTKYRHLNNLRLARCHIACTSIFWFIHGIFTFIYYDSNQNVCVITNDIFAKYYTYFYLPILLGILPLTITSIFSLVAFIKIRTIASRQINIVRLSRDRQLTQMTLVHALFIILTTIPFVSFFAYEGYTVSFLIGPISQKIISSFLFYFFSSVHFIFIVVYQNGFVNKLLMFYFIFI
jgi:hypothetical protein